MKRFESGEALAKEIGISASELQKTFDTYNAGVKAKKDPFGKKVCFAYLFLNFISYSIVVLLFWRVEDE